jgi:hypothetical protein
MIQRAIAIIEALAGGTVSQDLMLRVANAYLPDGVDPETATNQEKAEAFVRGVRRQVKLRVLQSEESDAAEIARLAARADVEANVDLGSD